MNGQILEKVNYYTKICKYLRQIKKTCLNIKSQEKECNFSKKITSQNWYFVMTDNKHYCFALDL